MKAIILAAGRGSRMMPLTEDTPKSLLNLDDQTILGRQISILKDEGVKEEDIIVVAGYLADEIRDFLKDREISIVENKEWDETDNLYSFLLTEEEVSGEDLLVINADAVFDSEIIERVLNYEGSCYPVDKGVDDDESLKVKTQNGELHGIIGKDVDEHDGATTEIFFISEEHIDDLYSKGRKISEEDKLQWFDNAVDKVVPTNNFGIVDVSDLFWDELDTPEELKNLRDKIETGEVDLQDVDKV